jgi:hypothetical protein
MERLKTAICRLLAGCNWFSLNQKRKEAGNFNTVLCATSQFDKAQGKGLQIMPKNLCFTHIPHHETIM